VTFLRHPHSSDAEATEALFLMAIRIRTKRIMIGHYDSRLAGETEISRHQDWETASSVSSLGPPRSLDGLDDFSLPQSEGPFTAAGPLPHPRSGPERHPSESSLDLQAVAQAYWTERAKFIRHLEKRFNKFQTKAKEEQVKFTRSKQISRQDRASARVEPPRKIEKAPAAVVRPATQPIDHGVESNMVIPHAANAVKTVTRGVRSTPVSLWSILTPQSGIDGFFPGSSGRTSLCNTILGRKYITLFLNEPVDEFKEERTAKANCQS